MAVFRLPELDLSDPLIYRMVRENHRPEEIWHPTGNGPEAVLGKVVCRIDRMPWPCPTRQGIRDHDRRTTGDRYATGPGTRSDIANRLGLAVRDQRREVAEEIRRRLLAAFPADSRFLGATKEGAEIYDTCRLIVSSTIDGMLAREHTDQP